MASQPTATNIDNNTLATTLPGLNPSTLDTITELAHLLSRLRTPPAGGAPSTTTAAPTPTPAATATAPTAPTAPAATAGYARYAGYASSGHWLPRRPH